MITRTEYLENSDMLHHAYYSQFAKINSWSDLGILAKKLKLPGAMLYESVNYLGLHYWDRYSLKINTELLRECGDYLTLANAVCIKKAAALNFLLKDGFYKYAVASIREAGGFKHHATEFFETHSQAFSYYESLTEKIKGVYSVDIEKGDIEPVNVSGHFFDAEVAKLPNQLKTIVNTAKELYKC